MLSSVEISQLAMALCATAETLGQTLSANAAAMMASDLAEYSQDDLAVALRACRRECKGRLTLSEILQRLRAADGRPEANEAWAIALQSFDEVQTVLLTPEIQQAVSAASPVMAAKDKIGARMAFIAAYERLVAEARRTAQPVSWMLSLGYSPELRAIAIQEGVRLGRISSENATALIAQHSLPAITQEGQAIAGLLTGTGSAPSSDPRGKLQAIRNDIQAARRRREVLRRWTDRKERRELAARKKAAIDAINAMQEVRGLD
jgi:hypothetical protein